MEIQLSRPRLTGARDATVHGAEPVQRDEGRLPFQVNQVIMESGCIETAYNQRVVLWSIPALLVLRT